MITAHPRVTASCARALRACKTAFGGFFSPAEQMKHFFVSGHNGIKTDTEIKIHGGHKKLKCATLHTLGVPLSSFNFSHILQTDKGSFLSSVVPSFLPSISWFLLPGRTDFFWGGSSISWAEDPPRTLSANDWNPPEVLLSTIRDFGSSHLNWRIKIPRTTRMRKLQRMTNRNTLSNWNNRRLQK